jgi:hypothetical protein
MVDKRKDHKNENKKREVQHTIKVMNVGADQKLLPRNWPVSQLAHYLLLQLSKTGLHLPR